MTDDPIKRYRKLVERLHELTVDGKIAWSSDAFNDSPSCRLGNYYVSIVDTQGRDGTPFIEINIKDGFGGSIDKFNDDAIGAGYAPPGFSSYWELMSDLNSRAIRQSSGVDSALDDIFAALDKKEVPF